jgi:NhaP-type Na+/H+ or K+/H+ antiporter
MQSLGPLSFSQGLARRLAGPFPARFVLQPLVAIILGIRDGITDAKLGRPPFVMALLFARDGAIPRSELLKTSLRRILTPLAIGIFIDMIVQWYLFDRIILWGAILVGALLVALPYTIARALTNRFLTNRNKRREAVPRESKPRRVA